MQSLDLEVQDGGRITVNRRFAALLSRNGLTSFDAFMKCDSGDVARRIGERVTSRLVLSGRPSPESFASDRDEDLTREPLRPADGSTDNSASETAVYLKRHGPPSLKERIKPWLHFRKPILGARNEWNALLRFYAHDLPTMTPVAFGESAGQSFLMTESLEFRIDLLAWTRTHIVPAPSRIASNSPESSATDPQGDAAHDRLISQRYSLLREIADIARRMHAAGLHHQDFYLNHLLLDPKSLHDSAPDVRVIDLGRVSESRSLSWRWIAKDLAQLDFSAALVPPRDRLRFLRLYLDRPFRPSDRWLIRWIQFKSRAIARHTKKNQL